MRIADGRSRAGTQRSGSCVVTAQEAGTINPEFPHRDFLYDANEAPKRRQRSEATLEFRRAKLPIKTQDLLSPQYKMATMHHFYILVKGVFECRRKQMEPFSVCYNVSGSQRTKVCVYVGPYFTMVLVVWNGSLKSSIFHIDSWALFCCSRLKMVHVAFAVLSEENV